MGGTVSKSPFGDVAPPQGFEPRLAAPKAAVLANYTTGESYVHKNNRLGHVLPNPLPISVNNGPGNVTYLALNDCGNPLSTSGAH